MTRRRGICCALIAAVLFGAGMPLIKLGFSAFDPLLLSAFLNLGAALGVALVTRIPWGLGALTTRCNRLPFAGSAVCGGVLAPVLLVWGIAHTPGSAAALLLNLEAPFTTLIAWFFFREKIGLRFVLGLGMVTTGGVLVSINGGSGPGQAVAGLAIAASCLCWAIDNNCTARLKEVRPAQFSLWKGVISGLFLLVLCGGLRIPLPGTPALGKALLLGAFCSGLPLIAFVSAIQCLGAGRAIAFFASAPFVGAALSVALLGDPVTPRLLLAAVLMVLGVAALLTEPHPRLETAG
jgi:drug/metabolite transporter (DMT)-like permease